MGWPGRDGAFPTGLSKEQELVALKQEAASLEQALGELRASIQELEEPAPDLGATAEK